MHYHSQWQADCKVQSNKKVIKVIILISDPEIIGKSRIVKNHVWEINSISGQISFYLELGELAWKKAQIDSHLILPTKSKSVLSFEFKIIFFNDLNWDFQDGVALGIRCCLGTFGSISNFCFDSQLTFSLRPQRTQNVLSF